MSCRTGNPNRNTNDRAQNVNGIEYGEIGKPCSRAAFVKMRFASNTACPERGMMGENHWCPLVGVGFVALRAPMLKIDSDGRPNSGLCTLSFCSAVSGIFRSSPVWNFAPGTLENFSWQYSHCNGNTFAGP